jgi:hypothetical protein
MRLRQSSLSLCVVAATSFLPSCFAFTTAVPPTTPSSKLYSTTTEAINMAYSQTASYPEYSEEQLKAALDSLLEGSSDPAFDGRHLFGFQDPNHKLSKLQSITATRILDYETYLVRTD